MSAFLNARALCRGARWLPALLAAGFVLSACVAVPVEEAERPNPPVTLRSIPRHELFAPREEWVYLWDRAGGPARRAVRVGKVPSGTPGRIVGYEPQPASYEAWERLSLENLRRWPVEWLRVSTARGEGWVRVEFVEPR